MPTLFIIDHNASIRQALAQRLAHVKGIRVLGTAGTGQDGIDQTHALRPDVVLLEPKLSDGKGLDVLRAIRADNPSARIIILTSYLDELEQQVTMKDGAEHYLLKDIDSARLAEVILGPAFHSTGSD